MQILTNGWPSVCTFGPLLSKARTIRFLHSVGASSEHPSQQLVRAMCRRWLDAASCPRCPNCRYRGNDIDHLTSRSEPDWSHLLSTRSHLGRRPPQLRLLGNGLLFTKPLSRVPDESTRQSVSPHSQSTPTACGSLHRLWGRRPIRSATTDNRPVLVVVEGETDIQFLRRASAIFQADDQSLPDLGQLERGGSLFLSRSAVTPGIGSFASPNWAVLNSIYLIVRFPQRQKSAANRRESSIFVPAAAPP